MSDVLQNTLENGIRTLTLNRPERRNALSSPLVSDLKTALQAVRNDGDTRAIILTGAGDKVFCAGADLNPAQMGGGVLAGHQARHDFVALLRAFKNTGVPIIAKLQGHVLAGGVGLLAAADLAIAADDIYVQTPELNVGLFPMMIMSLIARNVGRKHALELLLTAEKFPAQEAHRMGLINRVVPRADLDAQTHALATRLASFSPAILQLGRDAYYAMEDMPLDPALDYLCGQLSLNTMTEDAAEGVMAFIQKRAPEWKGK